VTFRGVRETCRWSNDLFRHLGIEQQEGIHDRERRQTDGGRRRDVLSTVHSYASRSLLEN